jgi:hypothetical protein
MQSKALVPLSAEAGRPNARATAALTAVKLPVASITQWPVRLTGCAGRASAFRMETTEAPVRARPVNLRDRPALPELRVTRATLEKPVLHAGRFLRYPAKRVIGAAMQGGARTDGGGAATCGQQGK